MRFQYNPYIWPLFASALITLTLTAYAALRRRGARGAGAFILNMTMLSVWALSAALEVSAADLPTALFFANMQYAGYCYFPVTLLAACLIFSGYDEWAKLRKLWRLGIVPTIIFALVWTDALHGLVRYDMRLDYAGPFPVIDKKYGPALYVNAAYAYALLFTSCALLLRRAIGGNRLYRRQMLVLFAGVSATIVPNMLYIFGLSPVEWLDITPMFFGPAGLLLAWGMFRFKILDIVPLARATLIETMNSGVMVLDLQERVLDINPFLARMLGISASAAITRGTREVCGGIPALAAACADPEAAHAEFAVRTGDASRVYEALFSPLCDGKGARIGGNGGIVVISGGSVNANSIQAAPTNGSGATVYRTVVTLSGVTTATKVTSLTAALGYGINDMYTDADGKPYLYLPADTHTTAAQTTDGATPPVLTSYTGDIVTVTGGTVAGTLSIPSSDAALSGLSISSGTLNPIFASGTYAYTASVANDVDSVNIAATKSHANVTMTLQKGSGSAAAWNGASIVQSLDVGANVFTITVTAQDGTSTQDYTVTVTRKASEPGNLYVPRTLTDLRRASRYLATPSTGTRSFRCMTMRCTSRARAPHATRSAHMADGGLMLLFSQDISPTEGFIGTLTITFPVGSAYEGQTVTVLHCNLGALETFTATVKNGKASITVTGLSPFAAFAPAGAAAVPPQTGDGGASWVGWLMFGVAAAGFIAAAARRRKLSRG